MGRKRRQPLTCTMDGCSVKTYALNLCLQHYRRLRKYGSPELGREPAPGIKHRFQNWWDAVGSKATPEECVIWPYNTENGYGPHRRICILVHGDPPYPDAHSAHSCGKGKFGCVNFHHLRWKTPKENMEERVLHVSLGIAEKIKPAKLSDKDVASILQSSDKGSNLARHYGVSQSLICRIRKGSRRGDVKRGPERFTQDPLI